MNTEIAYIKESLKQNIKFVKEEYKEDLKYLKQAESSEIKTYKEHYTSLAKGSTDQMIIEECRKTMDSDIQNTKSKYEKERKSLESSYLGKIKYKYVSAIVDALEADLNPSFLYSQIAKAGYDPEELLDIAIRINLKRIYNETIEEILDNDPHCSLEKVVNIFKESFGDSEIDSALIKETYDEVKEKMISQYESIESTASEMMLEDIDKGIEYIKSYPHLNAIVGCSQKTVEILIQEAKQAAITKQLELLKEKATRIKKTRNILFYAAAIMFLIGIIFFVVFFVVLAIIAGGIGFWYHKKYKEVLEASSK